MNTIAKIFCGVLVNRLEKWVDDNRILTDFQAGFRRNYSTVDQIFCLTSIIKAFQARKRKVYSFFVDFKAAFDLVNRNALMYKLSQLGLSSRFLKLLKEMYTDTKATVWDGSGYSKWFNTDSGVKQGCLLSALLFSLFINDIVSCIPGGVRIADTIINILLYADDIVLLAESPESLQLMINRLSDYCKTWGLTVNVEKSKIMIFHQNSRSSTRGDWFFNGNKIDVVKEFKYLGVKINSTCDFKKHIEEKTRSSQSLINMTWRKIFTNENVTLSTKYKIFDSVVRSTLCYAAQIWGIEEFEEVEKFQRNFLKKLFALPRNTPNYAIYLETGLPKMVTYTLKLQADYILKIASHSDNRLTQKMLMYERRNRDWWMLKWQDIAITYGVNLQWNFQNLEQLKENLYTVIQLQEDAARNDLVMEARGSESRIIYSQLNHNLSNKNYFCDGLSYQEISLIFKTRCELLHLNGIPYNGSFKQFCTLCNMNAKDDVFHFISICPVLKHQRNAYFGKKTLTMTETIDILNGTNWKTFCCYVKSIQKFRNLIITEYSS